MYLCTNCKEEFREPDLRTYEEPSEYWGRPVSEKFTVAMCPHCASEDIEEVNECKICGHATIDTFSSFCRDCHDDLSKKLTELQDRYRIDYYTLQDFIAEHFEF